jgi:uncharacterized protein YraI
MNKIVYLALLISTLACGVQSNFPVYKSTTPTREVNIFVTASPTPETMQVNGSWNFRKAPGEDAPLIDTLTDVKVRVYDCKDTLDGGKWCEVEYQGIRGWVNQRGLK